MTISEALQQRPSPQTKPHIIYGHLNESMKELNFYDSNGYLIGSVKKQKNGWHFIVARGRASSYKVCPTNLNEWDTCTKFTASVAYPDIHF